MMYCLVWQPFDPASKHPVYTSTPSLIGGTPARDGATTGESTACASPKPHWCWPFVGRGELSEESNVSRHYCQEPADSTRDEADFKPAHGRMAAGDVCFRRSV